ncbi:YncE family protein [Sphingomonas sp. DT-204]|uniref:YncE family protein n=1 Tax=Sphingomonas sp. DT-204 TaxID=3396166 RepID=UPI003F1972C6
MSNPFAVACAILAAAVPASAPRYAVVDRIPGPDGGYDYVSVDPEIGRVFVGRRDGVMAVDLADRKVIPALVPGQGVAAVLSIPGSTLMLSTNGKTATATLFDRRTGEVKATIPTGEDPDGAAYDPASGLAFVMNGGAQSVSVIDLAQAKTVASIPLGDTPEAAVSDGKGRLFVNLEHGAAIAVIDIATRTVAARYALAGCETPTGIAYDAASGLLISACQNGIAKLVDAATGRDRGAVPIAHEADGAILDAGRRLVYVPCNEGSLAIFPLSIAGKAGPVTRVPTQVGAYTAALDPRSGRIYLPAADWAKDANGDDKRVPGTFKLIVVAPQDGAAAWIREETGRSG